jgi:alpha-tubulin suppressor-like RCC1 family protein
MTTRRLSSGLLAAAALFLGACETALPPAELQIVLPARDAAGADLLPWADQPYFAVTVTGPDLEAAAPVTGLPGQTVTIEVAAGSDRSLDVQLFPAAGITIATHAGSAGPFDLAPGERRAETVDLWLLPVPVATPLPFTRIAAGEAVTCGITTDGSGWCWGWNANHAITPDGADVAVTAPSPIPVDEKIRAIDVGSAEVCAVGATSGAVFCFGQTGSALADGVRTINGLPLGDPARDVAVGILRSCAVLASGKVHCWGSFSEGCQFECAVALEATFEVTGIASAVDIDSAASYSRDGGQTFCARGSAGDVWCWGDNSSAQAGEPDYMMTTFAHDPVSISVPGGASAVGVGLDHACAVDSEGVLYCWGADYYGQVGIGSSTTVTTPTSVSLPASVVSLSVNGRATCAGLVGGAVYCFGAALPPYDAAGGAFDVTLPTAISGLAGRTPILGDRHVCGLDPAGQLQCIGNGREGQSGENPMRVRSTPAQVGTQTDWTQVSVVHEDGYASSACAIRSGRLFCWGTNSDGQLGAGLDNYVIASSPSPVEVGGTDWAQIDSYGYSNCGRRTNGSVWCWGYTSYAGTATVPAQQGTLIGATHFDIGSPSTICATAPAGLYCWGDLYYNVPGFTGMGTIFSAPQLVTTTAFTQVAVGNYFACGIQADATLHCWGNNSYGQIGNGTLALGPWAPTNVGGSGWAQVQAQNYSVCARKGSGEVYCWGDNYGRTLGLPVAAADAVSVPTQVAGLTQAAIDMSLSSHGICVTLADKTVRCAGKSPDIGVPYPPFSVTPLGIGAALAADSFVAAVPDHAWSMVRLGSDDLTSCGIQTDGSLWCWGNPGDSGYWDGGLGLGPVDHNTWRMIDQPVVMALP